MNHDLLPVYLQDHHAGAGGGHALAQRAAGENEGSDLGRFLAELAREIGEDRATLERLMDAVGVGPHRVKVAAAWSGEKLGRLKVNGSYTSYTPLSRLIELEGLTLGVTGKLSLWQNLAELARDEDVPHLRPFDFPALAARAEDQLARLAEHRRRVALEALGGP